MRAHTVSWNSNCPISWIYSLEWISTELLTKWNSIVYHLHEWKSLEYHWLEWKFLKFICPSYKIPECQLPEYQFSSFFILMAFWLLKFRIFRLMAFGAFDSSFWPVITVEICTNWSLLIYFQRRMANFLAFRFL